MAQSILIFDFGTNEEAAQQARHKIEAWQQGSRLGKKILLKFDRKDSNAASDATDETAEKDGGTSAKGKAAKKDSASTAEKEAKSKAGNSSSGIRLLIRLDFSDHEKLTQQRWLDRIPAEEPFKSAEGETIRHSDAAFAATSELFDSLD